MNEKRYVYEMYFIILNKHVNENIVTKIILKTRIILSIFPDEIIVQLNMRNTLSFITPVAVLDIGSLLIPT